MSHSAQSFLVYAPTACERIARLGTDAVSLAERSLATVRWHDPIAIASWVTESPFQAAVALAVLSDRPHSLVGERIAEVLPELAGLASPHEAASAEHQRSTSTRPMPLLDHVHRALVLLHALREQLTGQWLSLATTVLLFADVAKGGTSEQRTTWLERLGVDGAVHNEDSAVILEDVFRGGLGRTELFSSDSRWRIRARALVAVTGLVGMRIRGEVDRDAFQSWMSCVQSESSDREALARVWSIVNHCDTAAVREGLWTEALAQAFAREESEVLQATHWQPNVAAHERIARLRVGALRWQDESSSVQAAVTSLGARAKEFCERLLYCRVWYGEPVLGALSPQGSVRLMALLLGAARGAVDFAKPWHLDLREAIRFVRGPENEPCTYPTRLLETMLSAASADDLMDGSLAAAHRSLVSFPARKGGESALIVRVDEGAEARALLTLLALYERKEAAAFHTTLKSLCDLYGLRKDDFDRVSNEASYLATMNAARSDKARMLDYAVPGTLVEVGPGGGVVLDLIAERFPNSRVIGLDASQAVVEALQKTQATRKTTWEVIHGDAFKLPEIVGPRSVNTIVYCSVLHEIYSYVPWSEGAEKSARRFQWGSVAAMIAASFRTLASGGRIIVRDGLMPARIPRRVRFLDPTWREGLELFSKVYEARPIPFETLSENEVRMDQADLFEFLTTYTWGPDAFPYEIREQRGVLPRGEYVARMIEACRGADPPFRAREVAVPMDLASYLQKGYSDNIDPKVSIHDDVTMERVPMPHSNGVWVIEKVTES